MSFRKLPRYLCFAPGLYALVPAFGAIRGCTDEAFGHDWILAEFKLPRNDAAYWRSVRRFFLWLGQAPLRGATIWAKQGYKRLRALSLEPKDWDEVLSREIVRWAYTQLDSRSAGDCCVDNYRVARKRNTSQMRRYNNQRDGGCCGFDDTEVVGPDGHVYLLGFNYGH